MVECECLYVDDCMYLCIVQNGLLLQCWLVVVDWYVCGVCLDDCEYGCELVCVFWYQYCDGIVYVDVCLFECGMQCCCLLCDFVVCVCFLCIDYDWCIGCVQCLCGEIGCDMCIGIWVYVGDGCCGWQYDVIFM